MCGEEQKEETKQTGSGAMAEQKEPMQSLRVRPRTKTLIVWSLKVKIEKINQCRGNQLSHSGFCRCKILIKEEEETGGRERR